MTPEMLERVATGIEWFIRKNRRRIERYMDVEDFAQDVWLRVWRVREGYDASKSDIRTYAWRACLTTLIDESRRQSNVMRRRDGVLNLEEFCLDRFRSEGYVDVDKWIFDTIPDRKVADGLTMPTLARVMVEEGGAVSAVAARLHVSARTVGTWRREMKKRMGVTA